mmetsp:Transcript_12568/g.37768  ORF Transcript_12568/g.37768 Transcript_12568/m.37768 type:complete len:146 (+) Transcript_12568:172-609(+)
MISCSSTKMPITVRQRVPVGAAAAKTAPAQCAIPQRRRVLQGLAVSLIPASWFTAQKPCDAAVMGPAVSNEDDNAYIQGLLKRTDQFRDQRRKERLLAYERRNFQDYFGFESGSLEVAKSRGINEETFNAIKKWMKENETGKRIQ